jgi:hypothetical protein
MTKSFKMLAKSYPALLLFLTCAILFMAPDIHAQESGLINVNPDPDGEPWIAGGITREEWDRMTADLPSLDQILSKGLAKAAAQNPPDKVDNSILPAFRPIFNQKGGSCAQASSVAYVFTYEINTLRGLSSNVTSNQYPYDFSYNFCNSGSGNNGSNPNQGFEIAQLCGIPDVETYGGFGLAKYTQWMHGYNKYFAAMSNRALNQFTIKVNTTAGILQMRQWLNDHGTGAEKGGCLVFCYNSSSSTIVTLASGTPEGGKKALTKFGTSGGHAVTIAGYNDSVRYDYNGDNKYTNDVDVNNDRVVDVKDWEIGAVYMINSWGTSFGNSGKIYVPYRLCAETGGFWSNLVYGMRTDTTAAKPRYTYKISLSHDNRSLIRLRAGYANNGTATTPSSGTLSFGKAFNYSGGVFPMQGTSSEPIEIGLDVSRLAANLTAPTVTFFLIIDSKGGTGKVHKFSVMDYRNGAPVETVCDQRDVEITKGSTSSIKTLTLKIVMTLGQVSVFSGTAEQRIAPRITRSGNLLSFRNAGDKVSIIRLDGSQLMLRNVGHNGTLDISDLPSGIYCAKTAAATLRFMR